MSLRDDHHHVKRLQEVTLTRIQLEVLAAALLAITGECVTMYSTVYKTAGGFGVKYFTFTMSWGCQAPPGQVE